MSTPQVKRCAIYTRKSSEEGLDQDFNSLQAQREACEAFVASQRHEGWKLLPNQYDDGGISGGTLNRPGLERLLTDIEAARIDLVVVYKVDRLTRSLADFAKLIDRLEAAGASFVSVTQAFNTSTSMGRLTLNVLLSFAQFEREVTAERIRDKLAQSKAKGLWMGGFVPLGFEPDGRSLKIVPKEAETIQRLFELYDQHACLRLVEKAADGEGLRTKMRESENERMRGGKPFSRGRIQALLRNPIYTGRIRHKDKVYPGKHEAIISDALFDRVQEKLNAASSRPSRRKSMAVTSPLSGKVFDETGDRLTPSHTTRGSRRFRYYVSSRLVKNSGKEGQEGLRISAQKLETAVADATTRFLTKNAQQLAAQNSQTIAAIETETKNLQQLINTSEAETLAAVTKVTVRNSALEVTVAIPRPIDKTATCGVQQVIFETPFEIHRRGAEARLVLADEKPKPDTLMRKTLGKALAWLDDLKSGVSITELAKREQVSQRYLRSRLQMAFLSPTIMSAILEGRQPAHLTTETFVRTAIPLDWAEQARAFGFDSV